MFEKMKKEALRRIKVLNKELDLNPKVHKYFKEGKLYYSYWAVPMVWGCIDTITYDTRYAEAVKKVEEITGIMVYHAVECQVFGKEMLSLLYVSSNEADWETEQLDGDVIMACVVDVNNPSFYEFGSICLSSDNGALVRLG